MPAAGAAGAEPAAASGSPYACSRAKASRQKDRLRSHRLASHARRTAWAVETSAD